VGELERPAQRHAPVPDLPLQPRRPGCVVEGFQRDPGLWSLSG